MRLNKGRTIPNTYLATAAQQLLLDNPQIILREGSLMVYSVPRIYLLAGYAGMRLRLISLHTESHIKVKGLLPCSVNFCRALSVPYQHVLSQVYSDMGQGLSPYQWASWELRTHMIPETPNDTRNAQWWKIRQDLKKGIKTKNFKMDEIQFGTSWDQFYALLVDADMVYSMKDNNSHWQRVRSFT